MSLIRLLEIEKNYADGTGKFRALNNVSVSIDSGEFIAITGPSGSGKSTLLTILGVLNPPSKGQIYIDDIDVYSLSGDRQADFRQTYIGFVFQDLHLIPYLTALENVLLPLTISLYPGKVQKKMAKEVLKRVGLGDKYHRLPGKLSGGEKSRVAIARAIVNKPRIILADEPTGSLDSVTGIEIMNLFQSLNNEGITILLVTHNNENKKYVKKIFQVRDGQIEVHTKWV